MIILLTQAHTVGLIVTRTDNLNIVATIKYYLTVADNTCKGNRLF